MVEDHHLPGCHHDGGLRAGLRQDDDLVPLPGRQSRGLQGHRRQLLERVHRLSGHRLVHLVAEEAGPLDAVNVSSRGRAHQRVSSPDTESPVAVALYGVFCFEYHAKHMLTARFFVPNEFIARTAEAFTIPAGSLHRQITTVLRLKVGDPIALMPNDGTEIDCRITDITPRAIMGVIAGSRVPNPLLPEVTICAALLKRENFELILQKCTELGATSFIPLITDRTIKKITEVPERWQTIVREACEQSGRVRLPTIHEPMTYNKAISHTDGLRRIVLHEGDGAVLPSFNSEDRIALFIGPEGGFTEPEIALARDAKSHIVHLGQTVLRAETAAIAGLTLLRCR